MLQGNNQIGDDGAVGLGEGLKVNSSLQKLYLVRPSCVCLIWFVAREMQGVGGQRVGCTHACAAGQ